MTVDVAAAAQLACLLEVSAPKPGNISPGRHFADTRYEDFLASAAAVGAAFGAAAARPLGATINAAVTATSAWSPSNTNLGIVLLLAPLARAAARCGAPVDAEKLRRAVSDVLQETTVADARDTYAAIRLAAPGGLGRAATEDVVNEPAVTLLEAMRLAADRDGIAHEYATSFEVTFTVGAPALAAARAEGLPWDDAVVDTYVRIVARAADTHIVRRGGNVLADEVSRQARAVVDAGSVRSTVGRQALEAFDAALRRDGNLANPGTSADLTAAAIFVVLLGGGWRDSHGTR